MPHDSSTPPTMPHGPTFARALGGGRHIFVLTAVLASACLAEEDHVAELDVVETTDEALPDELISPELDDSHLDDEGSVEPWSSDELQAAPNVLEASGAMCCTAPLGSNCKGTSGDCSSCDGPFVHWVYCTAYPECSNTWCQDGWVQSMGSWSCHGRVSHDAWPTCDGTVDSGCDACIGTG